ncbi:MAG: hypothetical protein KAI91_01605 [Candidatus Omnitrophica bacterium]|nr:hypothetical protein [Candidatus Omnitrophota bacterium]MCK5393003.1 hypothetical protein [Candidatus Omnitrophota bacterium]
MLSKDNKIELNFGEQPIRQIMLKHNLKPHDLVEVSTEQITHRMVSRAGKGRRLTPHIQIKVLNALNKAVNQNYLLKDLFNY